jgi:hypothetical protein
MPRALRQAAAVQRWWIANRQSAPTLFRDELARVIGLLQENPELGSRIKGREIRRILLPDTEQFLYAASVRARNASRSLPLGARFVNSGPRCLGDRTSLHRGLRPR